MKGPELPSLRPRRLATIRGRILIGVLVLLAAGLIGNSVAGAVTLRNYLDHRAEVSCAHPATASTGYSPPAPRRSTEPSCPP